MSFTGRNARGELELVVPAQARIVEAVHGRSQIQLVIDGVELDAKLEQSRDVTGFGSPVRTIATYRDPQIDNRVIIRIELLAPCTTVLRRTSTGARLQLDEEAVW